MVKSKFLTMYELVVLLLWIIESRGDNLLATFHAKCLFLTAGGNKVQNRGYFTVKRIRMKLMSMDYIIKNTDCFGQIKSLAEFLLISPLLQHPNNNNNDNNDDSLKQKTQKASCKSQTRRTDGSFGGSVDETRFLPGGFKCFHVGSVMDVVLLEEVAQMNVKADKVRCGGFCVSSQTHGGKNKVSFQ